MKRLLAYLFIFLGLGLTLNVKADDVRDFEIDGYTINESLLEYYTEDELKKNWNLEKDYYGFKSKKYFKFAFDIKNPGPYEGKIIFYTLRKDKKYRIQSIAVFADFPDNIENCYEKQLMISKELKNIFKNTKSEVYEYNNNHDPYGQSTAKEIIFIFNDGSEAGISCQDWGKKYTLKNNSVDQLQVFIDSKRYAKWLRGSSNN